MTKHSGFKVVCKELSKDGSGKVFAELRENIRNAGFRKLTAANNATYRSAETLLEMARELVPLDTGTLQMSGEIVRGNRKSQWNVVFSATVADRAKSLNIPIKNISNPNFNYALIQHENSDFKHSNGRQWHYLSDPLNLMKNKFSGNIRSAMKRTKAKGRKLKDITEGVK